MKKAKKIILSVQRPNRDPDYWSKRSVPYWWAPEWIRGTSRDFIHSREELGEISIGSGRYIGLADGQFVNPSPWYGKIYPVKEKNDVSLYMRAKDGNLTFIQGSIQKEFRKWFIDRSIDYLLFGMDPDELIADAE